jgi:hypothetical protein
MRIEPPRKPNSRGASSDGALPQPVDHDFATNPALGLRWPSFAPKVTARRVEAEPASTAFAGLLEVAIERC